MPKSYIKLGLLVIIIAQIAATLYLVRTLKNFANNPENYYKDLLTHKIEKGKEVKTQIKSDNF